MIKVTHSHFVRILNSIQETEQQIERNPSGSFVEFNKLHAAALRKLVLELEVVDYLSSDEALAESERVFHRMNFFKGYGLFS
jgi:hypothetical protein